MGMDAVRAKYQHHRSINNHSLNKRQRYLVLATAIAFLFWWLNTLISDRLATSYENNEQEALTYNRLYHHHEETTSKNIKMSSKKRRGRIIVIAPTFYTNENDIRFELALDLCREASALSNELELIVIDASPQESIRTKLREVAGATNVRVIQQTYKGRKGAALREGISIAYQSLQQQQQAGGEEEERNLVGMIAFQEPEKVPMLKHWSLVLETMITNDADIVVPKRSDISFQQSYPIEQYHSERFANLYLDSLLLANSNSKAEAAVVGGGIDWTMGPIAFRANTMTRHWLKYEGTLWDMQLVPMVRAIRWYDAKLMSYEFDYYQPSAMKKEEEGSPKFSEKRLFQLNHLFDLVGNAIKEEKEGSGGGGGGVSK